MLFNSINFLFFFPFVTLIYFLVPGRLRWIWLLFTSYYFYMSWSPRYALLMLFSTIITYFSGLLIEYSNKNNDIKVKSLQKKIWLCLSIILNLLVLFLFKYFNFFFMMMGELFLLFNITIAPPNLSLLLPVGISFYTFQALSYTIDVYKGEILPEKSFGKYALFVSFFPQLVAGPIERSKNLLFQINNPCSFNYDRVKSGLFLMLWGFFQKVVVADNLSLFVNTVYDNYSHYSGTHLVVATVFFTFQIYCDFSGYTDIARGAAKVLGFNLIRNFKSPYLAISIQDFWKRWHISLSSWFKDYLYIPLGGSYHGKSRKYINIMITFLTSGLWHGASFNYVVWGCLNGIYQIISDLTSPLIQSFNNNFNIKVTSFSHKLLRTIITFFLINFAWIFFRAPSLYIAIEIIKTIISSFNIFTLFSDSFLELGLTSFKFSSAILLILLVIIADIIKEKNINVSHWISEQQLWLRWSIYYICIFSILFWGCIDSSYDASQFIYFQF